MGHSSKKKKKKKKVGGTGRRGPLKDHGSNVDDDNELLSEEITALSAIFEEDCKIVSGSPPQILIKLRPYSKDMGYEDLDISAYLLVRCLPGYPFKSPKLLITPEIGLTEADAENLLSLLQDQANVNAREGRVMIFNLVEAAQEFLSEIVPASQSENSPSCLASSSKFSGNLAVSSKGSCSSGGPFVYGFIDLFSGLGESWHWGRVDENKGRVSSLQSHGSKFGHENLEKKLNKDLKPFIDQDKKQGALPFSIAKLDLLQEEISDDRSVSSTDAFRPLKELKPQVIENSKKDICLEKDIDDYASDFETGTSESLSTRSLDQTSQIIEKDLLMVHLLRLVCSSKGPLAEGLPLITKELTDLGILSEEILGLASRPSSLFKKRFEHVFHHHLVSSKVPQFWEPTSDYGGSSTSLPSSRYRNDFEELRPLGHGGFGHVVLCKNKLDGRQYAVKKILLKDKTLPERILREVATLSRLQHQHVVRYYQAWFETGVADVYGEAGWVSGTAGSSTFSHFGADSTDGAGKDDKLESTYLYIQMEFCPRTLRHVFESYNQFDKDFAWHLFRQIVEGLAHIHAQGIIHRDLTPNNIFFDSRNEIKIGDFGLAKFLKLEQLDQDGGLPDTAGVSIDGTGQVGTFFYTAPEIEQQWPKIDEKADMYSLGVVFFELWYPFGTAMERHVILSDLKQRGELPATWVAEFPEQASLLRQLMSQIPSDRPSATELLQHALPPRMESELLDSILRMMQSSEDSNVYDKVVNAIFDDEALETKSLHQRSGRLSICVDNSSTLQYNQSDTELRDYVTEITREVFKQHCAKHLAIMPMRLLDDWPYFSRKTVKLLTHGGDMLELYHELRLPFVQWVVVNQKSSFKRYEISTVYRRAIGHSPPNHYLQGDFDIIGGATALTEAEVLKVVVDITTRFFRHSSCEIHLNHGDLLEAIWSWAGIRAEHKRKVAELLSIMGSVRPQSSKRKLKWVVIRRQLLQELNLPEAVVNRLQTVGLRFCGPAGQALPRLRGALLADRSTRKALDELSNLFSYLRVWRIEEHVYIDALMPPTEDYHRDMFFQVSLSKDNNSGAYSDGTLVAVGGRYDYLLHQMCDSEFASSVHKMNPPGAVGVSLALETIIQHLPVDIGIIKNEASTTVLVCSRGGGGLLVERMELVAELWEENIKAEFVPMPDPSLTEQYEYATEHDIKCLVIITEASVSRTDYVKVRHIELKKEKEVGREQLVKFLLEAMATQYRNPSLWN